VVPPLDSALVGKLLGEGSASAAAVRDWADAWRAGAADPRSFAASRLVLLSDPQGGAAAQLLPSLRSLATRGGVLEMTVDDCTAAAAADAAADGGPCQQRLERHLASATAARSPSLVLVRGAERCDGDGCFDAALGILERREIARDCRGYGRPKRAGKGPNRTD